MRQQRIYQYAVLAMLFCLGCTSDETPQTSLFEDDHHVAAHWPSDLKDLSVKLRSRIKRVRHGEDSHDDGHAGDSEDEYGHDRDHEHDHKSIPLKEQMEDLVDWVGEIAADTNLREIDWIPLYEKSNAVSANLRATDGPLSNDNLSQLESLCELIDITLEKVPEQLITAKAITP